MPFHALASYLKNFLMMDLDSYHLTEFENIIIKVLIKNGTIAFSGRYADDTLVTEYHTKDPLTEKA